MSIRNQSIDVEEQRGMYMNEDVLFEKTLELAAKDYGTAYEYLMESKSDLEGGDHPQLYYILSCLAAGSQQADNALYWLEEAVMNRGYWYRPEVLEDDDLKPLFQNDRFIKLKAISDRSYEEAQRHASSHFTWQRKEAKNLLIALHGNGQNAHIAKQRWEPIKNSRLQIEAVQSATVDSYDRFRWNYDEMNYGQFVDAVNQVTGADYRKMYWAGFSAGCDMILRTLVLTDLCCDAILMQSPWIPFLQENVESIRQALVRKSIALHIFCGTDDEDCREMARQLDVAALNRGACSLLTWQKGLRHQFPGVMGWEYTSVVE